MSKLKRTTEEVAAFFEKQDCKLLDEYHGCMEKMKYQCHCGCISKISWNNFSRGKRCGNCTKWGHKKKRSLKEVQQMYRDRGCEFLDDEFKGVDYKHRYRCACGKISEKTFGAFHFQNQLCHECGLEKKQRPKSSHVDC